jgi:excinuclease ABC subunit A
MLNSGMSPKAAPKPKRSPGRASPSVATAPRTTIAVQGARVHNLKNVSVEIPRDKLVVVTGLSGSGKSSLAFDTIYAEGQRRYMESLSSFAKRFVAQVAKPDVDFVFGLSPVISIEQKTLGTNPRSTVGTMTDIASYLNLLFATVGDPHCPRTGEPCPSRSASQILEAILSLPNGTEVELRAPVFKIYGEDLDVVFTEVRKKGCRRMIIDGALIDIAEKVEIDEARVKHMDAIVDRIVVESAPRAGDQGGDRGDAARRRRPRGKSTSRRASRKQTPSGSTRRTRVRRTASCTATSGPPTSCSTIPRVRAATCGGLGCGQAHALRSCSFRIRSAASVMAVSCARRSGTARTPGWRHDVYSLCKALGVSLDTPWRELPAAGARLDPVRDRGQDPS